MKKLRLFIKVSALIIISIFLLSGTGLAASSLNVNYYASYEAADVSSGSENGVSACFSDSPLSLKSDAPDELFFRYDAGAAIDLKYTINSALEADEYRVTCSGEDITLLSAAEYSTSSPSGSYGLQFRAPDNGEGKIILTLTAFSNGKVLDEEAHSYLYWSSCDCGVFLSGYSEPLPELAMAKAQFDAHEITSADYYNIVRDQHFEVDMELMNMLGQVISDNTEYSKYAAPYVEAVHNTIFGIEPGVEVPAISDTLDRIREDLGLDTAETAVAQSLVSDALESEADESVLSAGGLGKDTPITIEGTVEWVPRVFNAVPRPVSFIKIEIIDSEMKTGIFGNVYFAEKVLRTAETDKDGKYKEEGIPDGASVREGGYDIIVRAYTEGSNVSVKPWILGGAYTVDSTRRDNIVYNPITFPFNLTVFQDPGRGNNEKAIQVQQGIALASRYAASMTGSFYDQISVVYPSSGEIPVYVHNRLDIAPRWIEIAPGYFDNWFALMHEYGHYAADMLNIDASSGGSHTYYEDLWSGGRSKADALRFAWSEGWADYFSVCAQQSKDFFEPGSDVTIKDAETQKSASGETEESTIVSVLWDLADDSGDSEPFDKVNLGFQLIWDCADNHDCKTLNDFIKALSSGLSDSTKMNIGNILSEYNVSPRLTDPNGILTNPADGEYLPAEWLPKFEWVTNRLCNHDIDSFKLVFYDSNKNEIYKSPESITPSDPLVTTRYNNEYYSYLLPNEAWNTIINTRNGETIYWAVQGEQLAEPITGPYQSNYLSFIAPMKKPALSATSTDFDTIKLSWPEVTGATSYEIFRYDSETGKYIKIVPNLNTSYYSVLDTANGKTTFYYEDNDEGVGLTNGLKYYYKVIANITTNGNTYKVESDVVPAVTTLSIPSGVTIESVSHDLIDLSWDRVRGADRYEVWRNETAYGQYTYLDYSTDTDYTDTGLTIGHTYYYKVRAYTDATKQYSGFSSYVSAVPYPDFIYKPNSDGTVTIIGYSGNDLNIVIPSAIAGKTVTAIGDDVFSYSGATGIVIPGTVTSIGTRAFSNTAGLTSITIPNSVISIGQAAFRESSITGISLPDSLTEINPLVFDSSKLKSVVIPDSVTVIDWSAFGNCGDLSSITLSRNLVSIGSEAFSYTAALTSIKIPNSVTSIGEYAFCGSGITSVNLPNKLTALSTGVFSLSRLEKIAMPDNITSIGEYAFQGCSNLSAVTFSKNITHIEDFAFMDCSSLKDLLTGNRRAIPKNISYIGSYAFAYCTSLKNVNIDSSSADCTVGDWAFSGCTGLSSSVIENAKSAGGYLFYGCSSLAQAEFKDVKSIGTFAFYGCSSLKEVTISNAGTIGEFAFNECDALKKVSISDTDVIGMQAFSGCDNMLSASIDAEEIGSWAFSSCPKMSELKLTGTKVIVDGAFIECSSLTKVNIPKGTKTIGMMAFLNCSRLEGVSLPNSLTSIGINAFAACANLKKIVIPGSVTSIGIFAFAECTGLTKAVIPGSVSEISVGAFANCSSLKTVELGEGIQSIMEHAFAGCTSLATINRPGSLTFIDETAFEGAGTSLL